METPATGISLAQPIGPVEALALRPEVSQMLEQQLSPASLDGSAAIASSSC